MSQLLFNELDTELYQEITSTKNQFIDAFHLHLIKYNQPSGSLLVDIRDSNDKIIATSSAVSNADIHSNADAGNGQDYYHGLVRFLIDFNMRKGTTYRLVLKSTGGYSFSSSVFIGWCKDFDHLNKDGLRRTGVSYSGAVGYSSSFDFVAHSKVLLRKGRL